MRQCPHVERHRAPLGTQRGLMLPKSEEIVCRKSSGFFPQLIMMKRVFFRGEILFQTLGIWIATLLENGVIPPFLSTEKCDHNVVLCLFFIGISLNGREKNYSESHSCC